MSNGRYFKWREQLLQNCTTEACAYMTANQSPMNAQYEMEHNASTGTVFCGMVGRYSFCTCQPINTLTQLAFSAGVVVMMLLQVKALPGLGTTVDVILVNGHICEGDTVVVAGQEGPVVTQVRGLLMPQPLRELRVKVSLLLMESCLLLRSQDCFGPGILYAVALQALSN